MRQATSILFCILFYFVASAQAAMQTSAFSYQGELRNGGVPVVGLPDLEFRLYDALSNGSQIGSTISVPEYPVLDGLLTIELDFGVAPFVGQQRWLEISIDGAVMSPRQKLTATPYAASALSVVDAAISSASVLDGSLNANDIDTSSIQRRVAQACGAGSSIRSIDVAGNVSCETVGSSGDITAVIAGPGLGGGATIGDATLTISTSGVVRSMLADAAVGALQADLNQLQARVHATCDPGSTIQQINADGSIMCHPDEQGAGDITGVTAGTGLVGGGLSGAVSLAVGNNAITATQLAAGAVGLGQIDTSQVQARVSAACAAGSNIRQINSDGSVQCQLDELGIGDITAVSVGAGLVGGSASGEAVIAVGTDAITAGMIGPNAVGSSELAAASVGAAQIIGAQVQQRISGACPSTQALRAINEDGSVVCEAVRFGLARSVLPISSAGNIDVEIAADGLPMLAYVDGGSHDAHVFKCGNATCSSGNVDTTIDAAPGVGASAADIDLLVAPDGRPVVVYFEASQSDLRYVRCGDLSCSSGNTATTIQSSGSIGQSPRIALNAAGNPIIAYLANTPKRLMYSVCTSLACSSASTVTLATTPDVPEAPALVFNAGTPIVSYYESVAKDLRAIHCSDASCASASSVTLASNGDVGRYSAAVLVAGQVTIAFRDNGVSPGLKAVRCNDAICGSGSSAFAVDAEPNSGFNIGAAIATSGAPIFVEVNSGNSTVHAANCATTSCNHSNLTVAVDIDGPVPTTARMGIAVPGDGLPFLVVPRGTTANFLKCGTRTCF